ncbi:MAG: family 20 glycosylhydrolase [Pseudomonadota bacterium]
MTAELPPHAEGPERRIVPAPRFQEFSAASFRIDASTRVYAQTEAFRELVAAFVRRFSRATGFPLPVAGEDSTGTNAVRVLEDPELSGPGHYRLQVTGSAITIRAFDRAAALYGWQSLRQMLPAEIEASQPVADVDWIVPGVEIDDAPGFAYRGMHLDVSRHFFPVRFVKRYLDWMAKYKLNVFHWHLTDDQGWRIEIRQYPRLTDVGAWRPATVKGHTLDRDAALDGVPHGGYYTQDEIREVVEYAAALCITVIPEIDMPGHCSALLAAYPQFGCHSGPFKVETHFGVFRDILNPSDETLEMAKTVFGEVAALFPGRYLHIGGDEVDIHQWERSEECGRIARQRGLGSTRELYSDFISRLHRMVRELGKEPIGWDDILDGESIGPTTVAVWRGDDKLVAAAREGHEVILAPSVFYFDFYQSESCDEPLAVHGLTTLQEAYEARLVPEELDASERSRIVGGQGLLWTEYVATEAHAEYMLLPRLCVLAEKLWCAPAKLCWDSFAGRLRHHFERFDVMQINASRSVYNVAARVRPRPGGELEVTLGTSGGTHAIRYTLDGGAADAGSPLYEGPLSITACTELRAVSEDTDSGAIYGDLRLRLSPHKATACEVRLNTPAEAGWGKRPGERLVDGVLRRNGFFLHHQWTGFDGVPLDVVLDLGEPRRVRRVRLGFAAKRHRVLYPPAGMQVDLSADALAWRQVASVDAAGIELENRCIDLEFAPAIARYVRVNCLNDVRAYSHERKCELPVAVYADQIEVF